MILLAALLAGFGCFLALKPARSAMRLPPAVLPLAVALLLVPLGPAAVVAGALVAAAAGRARRLRLERAAQAAERAGAVEATAVLAAELRAGRSPGEALAAAATVAEPGVARLLAAAARALHLGADPVPLLSQGGRDVRGLAACLQVCAGSGSSLAAAVETVAEALRAEDEVRLAVETELAGPRATAALLAGLPLVGSALAAGLGAHPAHVLLHTPAGGCCLVAGVALDLAGLEWTDRLVRAAEP